MKKIYLLSMLLLLATFASAQKRTKSEIEFINSLEQIDSQELWSMREYAQNKFQSNVVIGSIVTGWGLSGIGTGAILMANMNNDIKESGPLFLGVGFGISIIGMIITSSAAKHRKYDLWIQKELWMRDGTALTVSPGGIRLTFGK